ncbi:ATP-binding protein [Micromonospora chalcea]
MVGDGSPSGREFKIQVMGRTLEHLGVQMYKRRDAALAELVANAWDAGAKCVRITLPSAQGYDPAASSIVIEDDGGGMSDTDLQAQYLVIGRNRRTDEAATAAQAGSEGAQQAAAEDQSPARKVMGRKGIGKLAGFGLAQRMTVQTWQNGILTTVTLDVERLKTDPGDVRTLALPGSVEPSTEATPSGTRITLQSLKHSTALDEDDLRNNLARRFSRSVRGVMVIKVNTKDVSDPLLALSHREPAEPASEFTETLPSGGELRWWAGFSTTVLSSEMQGFAILVRGKTAQAPPYFFGVESKASGQHGTKYLTGVIEADFLDEGIDDQSDRISTDRQEIDWSDASIKDFKEWGEALVRRLLREHADRKGDVAQRKVEQNPDLARRLETLDRPSRDQARRFIKAIGSSESDLEKVEGLADTILRAYEYRQFHDYIDQIDAVADDPDQLYKLLDLLRGWKVLESRAVLEVVKGRIDIVDKFYRMITEDAPETAPGVGRDNMHDLVADYPWLINPEWQVLAEERTLTKQLREWGDIDIVNADDRRRYDFLALEGDGNLVVIEIKRAGHPVALKDLQQVEGYADRLQQGRDNVSMAFITGDRYAIPKKTFEVWNDREDIELLTWRGIHERTKSFYEHYRAVLEGDVDHAAFDRKAREVARTRAVLHSAAYRSPDDRRAGLGPQDFD